MDILHNKRVINSRLIYMYIAIMLMICSIVTVSARTIQWAGRNWNVKSGYGGPGYNYWSDSTDNVWVDGDGYLHLKVTKSNDTWYCAEIISLDDYKFGDFRFQVATDIPSLDTNLVGGFFTYLNDWKEIDLEFARQFSGMTGENSSFASQPWDVPGNTHYFTTPTVTDDLTTHRFVWTNDQIYFQSYEGHGSPPSSAGSIEDWTYTGDWIPQEASPLHLNLYIFSQASVRRVPSDTNHTELIIRGALLPVPEPGQDLPAVTNMLFDFESGASGWIGWNPDYQSASTETNPANVYTGSQAMCFAFDQSLATLPSQPAWWYQFGSVRHSTSTNDWIGASKLSYWVSSDIYATNTLVVAFKEGVYPNEEIWEQSTPISLTPGYQQVVLNLDKTDFTRTSTWGIDNNEIDLDRVQTIEFKADKGSRFIGKSPKYNNIYIDNVMTFHEPAPAVADVTVSGDDCGFGVIQPSAAEYRFVSTNAITVNWSVSGASYWSLLSYTENADDRLGMVGVDNSNYSLPIRRWVGPAGTNPPNPMVQANWTNEWGFVNDRGGVQIPLAEKDNSADAGTFDLHFATEVLNVSTQDYSTVVTLDLELN